MDIKTQKNLNRASKLAKKGELKEAEKIFKQILLDSPNNQEAKKGLAIINQNSESARPTQDQIDFVMNLYSTGKIIEAIKSIDELVQQFPQEPLLLNISGACYLAAEMYEDAVMSFKKAVELKQDYAAAQYNLGVAYRSLGQNDSAMNCFKKAININPAYPDAHNNLGLILLQDQQIIDAVEHFEWAVAYKPEFAAAHNNLGAALQELRKYDESINSYKKAVEINPAYAQAHNNLGISYQIIGDKNKSIEHYEKALSIKSNYAQVHHDLSALKIYESNDPQIKTIEKLLSDEKTTESDRVFLCFALAKAYDDIGNSKGLYECLDEGNQLRKKQLNYSIDNSVRLHSVIKKLFSSPKPLSKKIVSKNLGSKHPIFILGMPRSGTTLVEQIIASHEKVYGAEEISTLTNLVAKILNDPTSYNTEGLQEETLVSLRNDYLNGLDNLNVNENVITDKLPLNFQYIGFILSSMPDAKIIHVTRDPRAICWSNFKHNFSSNGNGWAYNMQDLTDFYGLYEELMNFWHESFPNKIYDFSYENLTKNQEEETKKLLEYCELEWDKNCLSFYNTKRAVKTASSAQVRRKIYQGSSDAWKNHEKYLKPMFSSITK